MTEQPDVPFEIIRLRRGEFRVHKDCRVKVYDAFVETEPEPWAEALQKWLRPHEFDIEQWNALSDGEKSLSQDADCGVLRKQVEQLTQTRNFLIVAVFALCMTLVAIVIS